MLGQGAYLRHRGWRVRANGRVDAVPHSECGSCDRAGWRRVPNDRRYCATERAQRSELSSKLGDSRKVQATAVWGREDAGLSSTGRRNSSVRRFHELVQSLGRCSPSKRLARSTIQRCRHGGKRVDAVHAQVRPLRKVLAQQPIGVLVCPSLPRTVRIAEVDLNASLNPQLGMLAQLCSLVPGQRSPQLLRQGRDRARDGVAYRPGAVACECGAVLDASSRTVAIHGR